jgi:TolB-like protein/Tfp pilus assembly protein PilF
VATERESTWTRLRRRKVVQWGLVYVAAGWGFLQGLEYVTESFHWPEQFRQIALLASLIGLPIVLVLAWYHGDRGQQRISTPEFAILMVLLLLGGGVFWYYQRASEAARTEAAQPEITAQRDSSSEIKDARPSIAVLPFDNRSREADDAFFVDGIHDDILTQLSKVSALKVISRTSVEQFRNTNLPIKEIARQLGVSSVLEGGVQRAGDRVRVNVQLIDAISDAHLWAETYDRELTVANMFAIQSEVAAAIGDALKTALTPAERARAKEVPTQNLKAWGDYQLGKQRVAKRTSEGFREAEHFFRQAINADSQFALAWTGLADTLAIAVAYGLRPRDVGLEEADQAVATALEIEPDLSEAWASAGNLAFVRGQNARAEQLLRRAIALNPNYALAHHWLSNSLHALGRRSAALSAAEQAVALDPLSAIINNQLGLTRTFVGRFHDAIVAFQRVIDIDPTMPFGYSNTGDVYAYGFGQFAKAIPWYQKAAAVDPGNADGASAVALAYWELGNDREAGRWLAQALAIGHGVYLDAAAALLTRSRGDLESARKHAESAANVDPVFLFLIREHDVRSRDYIGARARYAKALPGLFAKELPTVSETEVFAAIDLALILQHTGEQSRANDLLDRSEAFLRTLPRQGWFGYGIADVAIYALRGNTAMALKRLREAEHAGWRRLWRYHRDVDPNLASIRNEPEFKAVFADIERDMAQQRARLAARPKDAPLELGQAAR